MQIIKGKHLAIDTKVTPILLLKKMIRFFFLKHKTMSFKINFITHKNSTYHMS